jgi:hypothetical protein
MAAFLHIDTLARLNRTVQPTPRQCHHLATALAVCFLVLTAANPSSADSLAAEASFLAEDQAAMDKMMAAMDIKPTGDVDHDFTAMMIPHYQGAIDMAQAELRHGHKEQLRRIAQEIIVEQQQEIFAMRMALGEPLPPPASAPDQPSELAVPTQQPTPNPTMNMQKEP